MQLSSSTLKKKIAFYLCFYLGFEEGIKQSKEIENQGNLYEEKMLKVGKKVVGGNKHMQNHQEKMNIKAEDGTIGRKQEMKTKSNSWSPC